MRSSPLVVAPTRPRPPAADLVVDRRVTAALLEVEVVGAVATEQPVVVGPAPQASSPSPPKTVSDRPHRWPGRCRHPVNRVSLPAPPRATSGPPFCAWPAGTRSPGRRSRPRPSRDGGALDRQRLLRSRPGSASPWRGRRATASFPVPPSSRSPARGPRRRRAGRRARRRRRRRTARPSRTSSRQPCRPSPRPAPAPLSPARPGDPAVVAQHRVVAQAAGDHVPLVEQPAARGVEPRRDADPCSRVAGLAERPAVRRPRSRRGRRRRRRRC